MKKITDFPLLMEIRTQINSLAKTKVYIKRTTYYKKKREAI